MAFKGIRVVGLILRMALGDGEALGRWDLEVISLEYILPRNFFSISFLLPDHVVSNLLAVCFTLLPEAKTSKFTQLWLSAFKLLGTGTLQWRKVVLTCYLLTYQTKLRDTPTPEVTTSKYATSETYLIYKRSPTVSLNKKRRSESFLLYWAMVNAVNMVLHVQNKQLWVLSHRRNSYINPAAPQGSGNVSKRENVM